MRSSLRPRPWAASARLRTKGYADKSALKLVGDRFSLTQRQRLAVMRSACSDQQLRARREHCVGVDQLAGRPIAIDGYNLLITVEAAMSGGLIFQGRDGCFRDLASIHGTYRRVEETIPAVTLIGEFLTQIGVPQALWLLDSPVSNSGRLKTLIARLARENHWNWDIRLTLSPDAELSQADTVVGNHLQQTPFLNRDTSCLNRAFSHQDFNPQISQICADSERQAA